MAAGRPTFTATPARGIAWFGAALCVGALPAAAVAQAVPVRLSACASITDSMRRLNCFDEGLAQLSATAASAAPTQRDKALARVSTPAPPAHGTARRAAATVVSIEDHPDDLIIHLDNGEVWEQAQEESATMNLHAGDKVTVEHSQGSYWLDGPSRVVMKVRQRLP